MTLKTDNLERLLSGTLTVAAVVFAVVLLRRELLGSRGGGVTAALEVTPPTRVGNWEQLLANGLPIWSSSSAGNVIVEFADLECPACRRFHTRLKAIASDSDSAINLTLVHFPLSNHRFARIAARALECASSQGRAASFVDEAFANQDSFGIKTWSRIAGEAGVKDTAAFRQCAEDTTRVERIETGRRLGEEMKLRGTPSVVINGWYYATLPDDDQLRKALVERSTVRSPK